jgi:hypothetical protein
VVGQRSHACAKTGGKDHRTVPQRELLETVASGRSPSRRVWQTRDTYPEYGKHRRREIRPRSRFIEVPKRQKSSKDRHLEAKMGDYALHKSDQN